MKRPRDSQRSRCYKWENENLKGEWLILPKDNTPLGGIGAQLLVLEVWKELRCSGIEPTVRVKGNRGRGAARPGIILLSRSYPTTQTTWYVLHELAHMILWHSHIAWHGPEFLEQYARLLDKYTAASYEHVVQSMHEAGLKTS